MTDLGIDLPSELAEVGAAPFDADIVWNRMNKGMILDVAAETIGSEWARNRAALKKTELVAAAAAAFRPDPARDPARDAAATRWMPPGFEPTGVPSKSESVPTAAAADAPEAPPVDQDQAPAAAIDDGASDMPAFLTQ